MPFRLNLIRPRLSLIGFVVCSLTRFRCIVNISLMFAYKLQKRHTIILQLHCFRVATKYATVDELSVNQFCFGSVYFFFFRNGQSKFQFFFFSFEKFRNSYNFYCKTVDGKRYKNKLPFFRFLIEIKPFFNRILIRHATCHTVTQQIA